MYRAIAANKRNTVFIMIMFLIIIGAIAFAVNYIWGNGRYGDFTVFYAVVIGAASGRKRGNTTNLTTLPRAPVCRQEGCR